MTSLPPRTCCVFRRLGGMRLVWRCFLLILGLLLVVLVVLLLVGGKRMR